MKKSIVINEVGPRDGLQSQDKHLSCEERTRLVYLGGSYTYFPFVVRISIFGSLTLISSRHNVCRFICLFSFNLL